MSKPREFCVREVVLIVNDLNEDQKQLFTDKVYIREVVPIDWNKVWDKYPEDMSDYYAEIIQQLVEKQLAGEE